MHYCRSEIVKLLAQKTGYFQKDIDPLLKAYDELIVEILDNVTDDEDVSIQVLKGCRILGHIVPERQRKDPRDQSDIIVGPTLKLSCRFSDDFKNLTQSRYIDRSSNGE